MDRLFIAEQMHINMEKEKDRTKLDIIAKQHKCTPETIAKIVPHYHRTGNGRIAKSTSHPIQHL